MATYFVGSSGECADCVKDDPCALAICGDTTLIIDTDTSNVVSTSCTLLLNDDALGYNYMIVAINGTTDGLMAIQVCDDGFNIGAKLSVSTSGTSSTLCKTSESSTTFAYVQASGVILYSLNTDTLEIALTSANYALPANGLFSGAAFITDGHLVLMKAFSNNYDYYDVDVSSGTSVSYGSVVTSSYATGSFGSLAYIGSNTCVALETTLSGSDSILNINAVTYSSGISLGGPSQIDSVVSGATYGIQPGGNFSSSSGGIASFLVVPPGNTRVRSIYSASSSAGDGPATIPGSANAIGLALAMNSSTLGVCVTRDLVSGNKIFPFTISGVTPSVGSTTSVTSDSIIESARAISSMRYSWPTGGITGDLIT